MFLVRRACHPLHRIKSTLPVCTVVKRSLFIQPGEEAPTLTMQELIDNFYGVLGKSRYSTGTDDRRKLMDLLPRDRNELPSRTMKDSFLSAIIPLKTNLDLRDRYINAHGSARIGRFFEDLDVFAGYCVYKHILNPRSIGMPNPYSCVTALVDSMAFSSSTISPDEDVRISGHVSWVGRSSVEISMLVDQKNKEGVWKPITDALFVFVARDPLNQGPAFVNPLVGESAQEKAYILQGEERSKKRRAINEESLDRKPPTVEEIEVLHKLFPSFNNVATNVKTPPPNAQYMSEWQVDTLLLCHPQYRNRFNKIFGGFIMRQAYEIAHSTVFLYSKCKPSIAFIDDILFRKPVEIGSLIRLIASVAYVEDKYVQIPVLAEVLHPEKDERSVTNIFQFTFRTHGQPPPLIIPNSYYEAMSYLEARRHFKESEVNTKP